MKLPCSGRALGGERCIYVRTTNLRGSSPLLKPSCVSHRLPWQRRMLVQGRIGTFWNFRYLLVAMLNAQSTTVRAAETTGHPIKTANLAGVLRSSCVPPRLQLNREGCLKVARDSIAFSESNCDMKLRRCKRRFRPPLCQARHVFHKCGTDVKFAQYSKTLTGGDPPESVATFTRELTERRFQPLLFIPVLLIPLDCPHIRQIGFCDVDPSVL